jgi:arylsulfatase
MDLAGATYPKQIGERHIDALQGRSLVPIFRGQTREPHETLYFHYGSDRALRQGPWKLVSAKLGKWELYDLREDRTELNDLAATHPKRVAKMAAEWFRMAKDVDRLKPNGLRPVRADVKALKFRKDTSSGSAAGRKRKRKNKK